MFDGLLSPWHLVIVAFVVFVVVGPRRIANRVTKAGKKLQALGEGRTTENPDERVVSTSGIYRLARLLRRRRP